MEDVAKTNNNPFKLWQNLFSVRVWLYTKLRLFKYYIRLDADTTDTGCLDTTSP